MPALAYGTSAYRRDAGGLPELRLVNMFVEQAPTSDGAVALMSRPGMTTRTTVGDGPVRGLFTGSGVLGGSLFTLSGSRFFDGADDKGEVVGSGAVKMTASATQLLVTAGDKPRAYGGTFVDPNFPDDASVVSVGFLAGLFLAIRAGTQRFYWSAVRDATLWDGLDYASAESSPDPLLDMVIIGDIVWFAGATTMEPWAPTGDADLPFSKIEARTYQRGVKATGCAIELDNTLFWVGDDGVVYRGSAIPERISDHGIEERIGAATSISVCRAFHSGHKFLCIRLDEQTFAYDVATLQWCEFSTGNLANWRVATACEQDGISLLGDATTGGIHIFDDGAYTDAGADRTRVFTALAPTKSDVSIDTLHLEADFGGAPLSVEDPQIEVRSSRDSGRTWTPRRAASLGRQGQYRVRSEWRRFGTFDAPGGMFEFRVTDPVPLRISAVMANEPQGGRSR